MTAQSAEHAEAHTSPEALAKPSFLMQLRGWGDELVIAFVVALFVRTFVVELFKIPSGSMSPTLLGGVVAEGTASDIRGIDGEFMLIYEPRMGVFQVFQKEGGHYSYLGRRFPVQLSDSQRRLFQSKAMSGDKFRVENHRILVNRAAYWFNPPKRGDIVVFRVPFEKQPKPYERNGRTFMTGLYNRNQGVYVKRAVGLPGETIRILDDGRLAANGKPIEQPPIFRDELRYNTTRETREYEVKVPDKQVIVFGDNTDNSLDSRYWGGVPFENLRGRAILRYWPWQKARFFN